MGHRGHKGSQGGRKGAEGGTRGEKGGSGMDEKKIMWDMYHRQAVKVAIRASEGSEVLTK